MTLLPTSDRPEPVLDAAKLASAVSGVILAVGAVLVLVGWATTDQIKSWAVIAGGAVTAIGTLIAIVLPIITAMGARAQVTPLAAPVSVDGIPLITAAQPPAITGSAPVPAALPPVSTASMSKADYDAEYQKWVTGLNTDEPTEPAPTQPVDRTPQPIELEAQAAATNPGLPAASGDDTGVIPTVGQPPVPAGATAVTTPTV